MLTQDVKLFEVPRDRPDICSWCLLKNEDEKQNSLCSVCRVTAFCSKCVLCIWSFRFSLSLLFLCELTMVARASPSFPALLPTPVCRGE